MVAKRPIDILIWGVSGYTGKLAATYLAKTYGPSGSQLSYALGGRSQVKLIEVQKLLEDEFSKSSSTEKWTNPKIFVSELNETSHDQLVSILQNCSVLLSFAGPFTLVGEVLVKACVAAGTHYCDSTGELDWVKKIHAKYNDAASEKKLKLVPCCGFDYVPSDMAIFGVAQEIAEARKSDKTNVKFSSIVQYFVNSSHNFSAGTLKSGLESYSSLTVSQFCSVFRNPFSLCDSPDNTVPPTARKANRSANQYPLWSEELKTYVAPFVMTGGLSKNFHWSNYLSNYSAGKEVVYTVGIPKHSFFSALMAALMNLLMELIIFAISRFSVLKQKMTKDKPTGMGPDLSTKKHSMSTNLAVKTEATDKSSEEVYLYKWNYNEGEAYLFTGMACIEAAVTMAQEGDSCPAKFGVTTPSIAMGSAYMKRLTSHGIETSLTRVNNK